MREDLEARLQGVASMRRAVAGIAIVALLSLSFSPRAHPGEALAALDGVAVTASDPAPDGNAGLHDDAHRSGLCSICRALGQTRSGLRSTAFVAPLTPDRPGAPLPVAQAQPARAAPGLAPIGPRAPPPSPSIRIS